MTRRAECPLALFLLAGAPAARTQSPSDLEVSRAALQPGIDGDLNDDAWRGHPFASGQWVTYNPHRGEKVPIRTDIRVPYDDWNVGGRLLPDGGDYMTVSRGLFFKASYLHRF